MNYVIDIQNATAEKIPFTNIQIYKWIAQALNNHEETAEITVRIVNEEEIAALNNNYRKNNKPTNVLAFPAEFPEHIELTIAFLGDIIICPTVLLKESQELNKSLESHWAHIVIHGTLHLLGYDHIAEVDQKIMQQYEISALQALGFDNPYSD